LKNFAKRVYLIV